jgi:hypothetical protein
MLAVSSGAQIELAPFANIVLNRRVGSLCGGGHGTHLAKHFVSNWFMVVVFNARNGPTGP